MSNNYLVSGHNGQCFKVSCAASRYLKIKDLSFPCTAHGLLDDDEQLEHGNKIEQFKAHGEVVHGHKSSQHVKTSQYLEKINTNQIQIE